VRVEGSPVEQRVARLYDELEARGLSFRPHVWLSTDWFSPDSVPGIALPFYLADPRLVQLERRHHFIAEGSSQRECMRLLRHEAGHALDTAYGLARRLEWRGAFGPRNTPYRGSYTANPFSRAYVRHLPRWYAQSHPAEDFAETFAVWLTPRSRWRSIYAERSGARRKLEVVDDLMREIASGKPSKVLRERPYSLAQLTGKLKGHYETKLRARRRRSSPPFDSFLRSFSETTGKPGRSPVAAFLRQREPRLIRRMAQSSALERYDVLQVLEGMVRRARKQGLHWLPGANRPTLAAIEESVRRTLGLLRRRSVRLNR